MKIRGKSGKKEMSLLNEGGRERESRSGTEQKGHIPGYKRGGAWDKNQEGRGRYSGDKGASFRLTRGRFFGRRRGDFLGRRGGEEEGTEQKRERLGKAFVSSLFSLSLFPSLPASAPTHQQHRDERSAWAAS